ncbi:spore germination protein [Metabacillus idriensis]|uniref:spore germination protein n=1 Tax=Metabacillus idriensis TaxID=324768 RepID=UPI001747F2F5|nr:spore germination protein [Metabacillus idriensis]
MPSIIGSISINTVSGGVVNFGDSFNISPKSVSKAITGSGGGNNGNFITVNNGISKTNSIDPDVNDLNQAANL